MKIRQEKNNLNEQLLYQVITGLTLWELSKMLDY